MIDQRDEAQLRADLAQVPGFAGRTIGMQRIAEFGGQINRTVLLTLEGSDDRFVVRLPGGGNEVLDWDPEHEVEATAAAASAGVGPEVVAFLRPRGPMITRFIEGPRLLGSEIAEPVLLGRVATAMRRVHDGPPFPGTFDPVESAETFLARARRGNVSIPEVFEPAGAVIHRIVASGCIERTHLRPCHNDPFSNLIDDGVTIRLIDWEDAAMGDPFFDLGTISVKYGLTPHDDAVLLAAYDGADPRPERLARISLMRIVSDFQEAAWHMAQQSLRDDREQVDKAVGHLDQMLAAAAAPAFEDALEMVSRR